ncbi:L,D-transpeptidase [Thorsellia anophelis]|uniref:Murein L,D-transpeptidase YcbB/YkuD n=1 Tax=Thorsellia anophelis DSM 18579 TaxID=1123402 RepID=A0A1H9ZBC1_9GAMM|nr:L,D-transpeptidase [Thorsellia anophelis]SES78612.1 Murein L,D-transpeptidase YcbB/YkuD [Thorsellia anophelis DSM 18579]
MQNYTKKLLLNSFTSYLLLTTPTILFAENEQISSTPVETQGAKLIGVVTHSDGENTQQELIQTQSTTTEATTLPSNVNSVPTETKSSESITSQEINTNQISATDFDYQAAKAEASKLDIKFIFDKKIESLYTQNPMHFWNSTNDINAFKTQLSLMALSGISSQYQEWLMTLSNDSLPDSVKELVLTDAMIGYLHFTQNAPKQGDKWLYKNNSYNLMAADESTLLSWINSIKSNQQTKFINDLNPQNAQFEKMFQQLQTLINAPKVEWPTIEISKSLKPNTPTTQGDNIAFVLNYYGMLDLPVFVNAEEQDNSETAEIDNVVALDNTAGVYNQKLINGIKYFQQSYGLESDGVIGPRTAEWLNVTPEHKISLLALNMQRLRLIPANVETGIMVNIPDYSLRFFKEGEIILDSKVIVGSPARKTPIMSNSINRVVINPPWSVPTRLAKEDIAPKGIKDPHYFVRNGYSLVELSNGQPISVDDILWENVSADSFPFAIRQSPGSGNSLGRYKFDMPNDQAIYLHDTPNHNLFKKDIRAISSGCIRVNKSTELANLLLNVENWDSDKIAGTVKKGNTTPVNLANRVPVELYYMTAWIDDVGTTQFRTDIYQYDKISKNGINIIPIAEKIL